ncbi:MAG: hypothetical protein EB053_07110 [Chlamydiae bacterium]|nr:hypothetical protein [Chlamydiota bacterium]
MFYNPSDFRFVPCLQKVNPESLLTKEEILTGGGPTHQRPKLKRDSANLFRQKQVYPEMATTGMRNSLELQSFSFCAIIAYKNKTEIIV